MPCTLCNITTENWSSADEKNISSNSK